MIDLSMTNFHSSLAQLLQSNSDEVPEAPTSLFDLINAHKSTKEVFVPEDVETLSDLTSKRLTLKEDVICSCTTPSSTNNELGKEETSNFSTLQEYAQSFLSNNSRSTFLSQKPSKECVTLESTNNEASNVKADNFNSLEEYSRSFLNNNRRTTFLSEKPSRKSATDEITPNMIAQKLSNVTICSSSPHETRKIDLTMALSGSTQNRSTAVIPERITRLADRVFYPMKECTFDVSTLADEDILYRSDDLSYFGYVINKKWSRNPLPRKCRKIGRFKPYNTRLAFKFDTPSPDDIFLKARNRTTSSSKD